MRRTDNIQLVPGFSPPAHRWDQSISSLPYLIVFVSPVLKMKVRTLRLPSRILEIGQWPAISCNFIFWSFGTVSPRMRSLSMMVVVVSLTVSWYMFTFIVIEEISQFLRSMYMRNVTNTQDATEDSNKVY